MRLAMALMGAAVSAAALAQNPAARPVRDVSVLAGRWNGAHIEQRSNCTTATSNGFHGTYSEYVVRVDAGNTLSMDEVAVTGLTCNYAGIYRQENGQTTWTGNHTCSDGRAGPFELRSLFALTQLMSMRLSIQMQGKETCTVDAIVSGVRFTPER